MYSRPISRHIGKHIPGKPAVIVENMTFPVFSGDFEKRVAQAILEKKIIVLRVIAELYR